MSTNLPRFQSLFSFLHHFVLEKLATTSIRVKVIKGLFQLGELCEDGGGSAWRIVIIGGALRPRLSGKLLGDVYSPVGHVGNAEAGLNILLYSDWL